MNTNTPRKQIDGFEESWIVTTPGPKSELEDCITHVQTFEDLQNQILGGLRAEQISKIFTQRGLVSAEQNARNHAEYLLNNRCEICESKQANPKHSKRFDDSKICDECVEFHDNEIAPELESN